jgi:hypothetical protein
MEDVNSQSATGAVETAALDTGKGILDSTHGGTLGDVVMKDSEGEIVSPATTSLVEVCNTITSPWPFPVVNSPNQDSKKPDAPPAPTNGDKKRKRESKAEREAKRLRKEEKKGPAAERAAKFEEKQRNAQEAREERRRKIEDGLQAKRAEKAKAYEEKMAAIEAAKIEKQRERDAARIAQLEKQVAKDKMLRKKAELAKLGPAKGAEVGVVSRREKAKNGPAKSTYFKKTKKGGDEKKKVVKQEAGEGQVDEQGVAQQDEQGVAQQDDAVRKTVEVASVEDEADEEESAEPESAEPEALGPEAAEPEVNSPEVDGQSTSQQNPSEQEPAEQDPSHLASVDDLPAAEHVDLEMGVTGEANSLEEETPAEVPVQTKDETERRRSSKNLRLPGELRTKMARARESLAQAELGQKKLMDSNAEEEASTAEGEASTSEEVTKQPEAVAEVVADTPGDAETETTPIEAEAEEMDVDIPIEAPESAGVDNTEIATSAAQSPLVVVEKDTQTSTSQEEPGASAKKPTRKRKRNNNRLSTGEQTPVKALKEAQPTTASPVQLRTRGAKRAKLSAQAKDSSAPEPLAPSEDVNATKTKPVRKPRGKAATSVSKSTVDAPARNTRRAKAHHS